MQEGCSLFAPCLWDAQTKAPHFLPGVGWPQRSQGWPGLRPWCPSLSAPHPRPCLLPALMVDVPMR